MLRVSAQPTRPTAAESLLVQGESILPVDAYSSRHRFRHDNSENLVLAMGLVLAREPQPRGKGTGYVLDLRGRGPKAPVAGTSRHFSMLDASTRIQAALFVISAKTKPGFYCAVVSI